MFNLSHEDKQILFTLLNQFVNEIINAYLQKK